MAGLRVLFLGHSRIVQRRVLPALETCDSVTSVEVASRRGAPDAAELGAKAGEVYGDFEQALSRSEADVVYVSTVNSEHVEWTRRALEAGFHVVVDKPAALEASDAEALVDLARRESRGLVEALVWADHPQIEVIRAAFSDADSHPTRVSAFFSVPPLDEGNFRYRPDLGGGSLYDIGPYAVSIGRVFFDEMPMRVEACVHDRGGAGDVDLSFSALLVYSGGRAVVGHFGFDTEYSNQMSLVGPGASVHLERIFTTAPAAESTIHVRAGNSASTVSAPAADSFACFFDRVARAVDDEAAREESMEALLSDARALAMLRHATEEA